jgi:haloalkane dehalogenase
MIECIRTPDERFSQLPQYDFEPNYVECDGIRIHYVDQAPTADATGEIVVMLHGEPSWSYLYRKMIPIVAAAGHRVIAPDLVGFGRSDKPVGREDYSYAAHVEWMRACLFDQLGLEDITLVCQDWGGLIGLRLVGEHPERFARVVAANTALPHDGSGMSPAFAAWLEFSQNTPDFKTGAIISGGTTRGLSDAVAAAYDAPFPDDRYKAGARVFPTLVPVSPDDPALPANRKAWAALAQFRKPFLTAFSDSDPLTKNAEKELQTHVPGAAQQNHLEIHNAGHFLQEDNGEDLAAAVVDFVAANPR